MDIEKISDAEFEILQILWNKNRAMTSTEIYMELNELKGWEKSTVRTLILRLTEKKAITQEKKDIYYYKAKISEKDFKREKTSSFLNRIYKGNAKSLIASLFEEEQISKDDIDELKSFWQKGGK